MAAGGASTTTAHPTITASTVAPIATAAGGPTQSQPHTPSHHMRPRNMAHGVATTEALPDAMAHYVMPTVTAMDWGTPPHHQRRRSAVYTATAAGIAPAMVVNGRSTPSHPTRQQTPDYRTATDTMPSTPSQLSTPSCHLQQLPTAHTSSGPIRVSRAAQKFTNRGWHCSTWITVPAHGSLNILQQKNEILHILRHSISLISYFIISHDAFPLLPARKAACSEAITTAAQNNPLVLNCIQHDEAYSKWLCTVVSLV
jgi:hypothetical protein